MGRAAKLRDEIARLGWEKHYLNLLDVAVAVRYPDGSLTLNGEPFPIVTKIHRLHPCELPRGSGTVGTADDRPGRRGRAGRVRCAVAAGISDDFVREVAGLIKPGTSVLFVLDDGGDIDAILPAIRGLGGTVLKTNVDLERAKLIQSTLADSADTTQPNRPRSVPIRARRIMIVPNFRRKT